MKNPIKDLAIFPGWTDIFGLFVLGLACTLRGSAAGDPGIGWHMRSGEWMVQHKQIPSLDPFLTHESPWLHTQWLSDVVFWMLYELRGWPLLEIFVCSVMLLTIFGVAARLLKGFSEGTAATVIVLVTLQLSVQWFLRPVIFSFLFYALVYLQVAKGRRGLPGAAALFVLFALWANLHPGFPMGLLLLCAYWIAAIGERRELKAATAALLAAALGTLCTPHGWLLHLSILKLLGDTFFMNLNVEWFSPDLTSAFFLPFAAALTLTAALVAAGRGSRIPLAEKIALGAFVFLALTSRRYIPFFALTASLPIARMLNGTAVERLNRRPLRMPVAVFIGLTAAVIFTAACGRVPGKSQADSGPDAYFPAAAVNVLEKEIKGGRSAKVFATPDWGGYLTWRLYPAGRAFIDDRNELNGVKRYEDFLKIYNANPGWESALLALNPDYALLEPSAALRYALEGRFRKIFEDDKAVLFDLAR